MKLNGEDSIHSPYVYGQPLNGVATRPSVDEELLSSELLLSNFTSRRLFARRLENHTCKSFQAHTNQPMNIIDIVFISAQLVG